jgi:hypothetical protein
MRMQPEIKGRFELPTLVENKSCTKCDNYIILNHPAVFTQCTGGNYSHSHLNRADGLSLRKVSSSSNLPPSPCQAKDDDEDEDRGTVVISFQSRLSSSILIIFCSECNALKFSDLGMKDVCAKHKCENSKHSHALLYTRNHFAC